MLVEPIELNCIYCGHKWIKRKANPVQCPNCQRRLNVRTRKVIKETFTNLSTIKEEGEPTEEEIKKSLEETKVKFEDLFK